MRDGPRGFAPDSSCPALLRWRPCRPCPFRLRGFHPLRPAFPRRSATNRAAFYGRSYYPGGRVATPPVWAPPLSLAATRGITVVFFSCGYGDVSVPRVGPTHKWCPRGRVPPFGHPRIAPYLPVPAVFRSLSRPSSPPGALGIPHAPCFAFLLSSRPPPIARRGTRFGCVLQFALTLSLACAPCQ